LCTSSSHGATSRCHLSSQAYPYDDLIPHLMHLIEAFGPHRLAWASDHTVSKIHHSWAEDFHYILDSNRLSQTDKEWLLGRTTRTILKWS
jgi:predicted TIM-barrel fold metal-dependent hydrolase